MAITFDPLPPPVLPAAGVELAAVAAAVDDDDLASLPHAAATAIEHVQRAASATRVRCM
jgi:hypothetical protein